ncbi:MAG: DUF6477 family protein [Pseudomonadota bacterium]
MTHFYTAVSGTRPSVLIRAARLAQKRYNRKHMLMRWLLCSNDLSPGEALADFREMEGNMNDLRLAGSFDYRITDHVELLAAVLFEWTLSHSSQPNASGSEALRSAM